MVSKKWKLIVAGAAAAITIVALTGCTSGTPAESASSSSGGTKAPYVMYVNLPITGSLSDVAQANLQGLEVAVDQVNKEGGILGRKVKIVVSDDQLDTTKAVSLFANYLSSHPAPQAVFLGTTSNEALAMLPVVTRNKIISFATALSTALDDTFAYPYAFYNFVNGNADANAVVGLVKKEGYKSVALIAANDANGQNVATLETAAFQKAGIAINVETYTPGDIDMTSQLLRLQAKKPDVLIIQGFGAFAGHVLTSRTKLGWDIPTIGHDSLGNGANLGQISSPADWKNLKIMAFGLNTGEVPNNNPKVLATFKAALKAKGSKIDQPLHLYTSWSDMVWVLKAGAEQAKSVDPDKVKAALDNLRPTKGTSHILTWTTQQETYSKHDQFDNFNQPQDAFRLVAPGPLVEGVITPPKG